MKTVTSILDVLATASSFTVCSGVVEYYSMQYSACAIENYAENLAMYHPVLLF